MKGVADIALDGAVRQLDAALQDTARKAGETLSGRVGMNGGQCSRVTRIEKLQKIERLAAANLPQQNTIWPVTERCFQQVADGDARHAVLGMPCFEANQVRVSQPDLRGIFDQEDALVFRNEFAEDVEGRRLAGSGATANQNILARKNVIFEPVGERLVEGARGDQVLYFEMARIELANRERDA